MCLCLQLLFKDAGSDAGSRHQSAVAKPAQHPTGSRGLRAGQRASPTGGWSFCRRRHIKPHHTSCLMCAFPVCLMLERKGRMVQRLVQIETQRCSEGESGTGKRSSDSKRPNMLQYSCFIEFSIWRCKICIFVCFLRSYHQLRVSLLLLLLLLCLASPLLARSHHSLPLQGLIHSQGKQVNYHKYVAMFRVWIAQWQFNISSKV